MAYVVTAVWTAKPGQEEAVSDILRQLVPASRAEPGCSIYQVYRDPAEPRVFRLFETYDNEAAFLAHAESEHFKRFVLGEAVPLLEGRERAFYETFGDL
jgi:quinol monooxygenase YgiN